MYKKTIKDADLKGKRVLIRVDFNVPIKDGQVEDGTRIVGALPTIRYAIEKGAKVILASHLGRPKGERAEKYSLRPVFAFLKGLLDFAPVNPAEGANPGIENSGTSAGTAGIKTASVYFADDCVGETARSAAAVLKEGDVLLLENLRFHKEEEANDEGFARELAGLCDIYVNDAFGTAHRAHASTEGVTRFADTCVAGLLMEKELKFLGKALTDPERPFVAILGGAKVSDKIPVIKSLIERKVDKLLIAGAMAYTFLKANGYTVGKSLVEDDMMPMALEIEEQARQSGVQLLLPTDHQVVDSFDPLNSAKTIPVDFTNAGLVGLDIGAETIEIFKKALEGAGTIIWNGPMGMFEEKPFDAGTLAIAQAVADATDQGAISIVGGGDSVSAVNHAGLADRISHISTGGGAALEFLAGDLLPGVEALDDR